MVAAIATVYCVTACPYVVGGDSAEFATLLATGGVAHPPGYPLYVLVLRALRWLPAGSPAHRAALITAGLGVLCVFATMKACRAWGASTGASTIAAVAYGSSSIQWKLSTHAEVFAMSALFGAMILCVSAPGVSLRGWRRALLLGMSGGLGLSAHTALVLFAPVGMWASSTNLKEERRRILCIAAALGGLCLGLAPYASLIYVSHHTDWQRAWVWGNVHDATSLVRHFLRKDYGSLQLSLRTGTSTGASQVLTMLVAVTREMVGLPLLVAAVAFGLLAVPKWRRRWSGPSHAALIALFSTFILSGPALVALFNHDLDGPGALFVERFYLIPMVPLTVLSALALDALLPVVKRTGVAVAFASLTLVAGLALSADAIRDQSRPTLQYYVENSLRVMVEGTVVLGLGDDRFGGYLYALNALAMRPDVTFISPQLLLAPWYLERIRQRLGFRIVLSHKASDVDEVALIRQLISTGHPVALSGITEEITRALPTYPLGPVVIVVLPGRSVPSPMALEAMNLQAFSEFQFEAIPPSAPDTWESYLQADYAQPWLSLAAAFRSTGQTDHEQRCAAFADRLAPWLTRNNVATN